MKFHTTLWLFCSMDWFDAVCAVRGYHQYRTVWAPEVVEILSVRTFLPPLLIFKGKRELKFVVNGMHVTVSEKAWMNEDKMMLFIKQILVPYYAETTEKLGIDGKAIFLSDMFKAHLTDKVQTELFAQDYVPMENLEHGISDVLFNFDEFDDEMIDDNSSDEEEY